MKRMALAAAALIASLGLIAPTAASACEGRRPVVYGYRPQPPGPIVSLRFGPPPPPVVVYRQRPVRYYVENGYAWGPPRNWHHRDHDDD